MAKGSGSSGGNGGGKSGSTASGGTGRASVGGAYRAVSSGRYGASLQFGSGRGSIGAQYPYGAQRGSYMMQAPEFQLAMREIYSKDRLRKLETAVDGFYRGRQQKHTRSDGLYLREAVFAGSYAQARGSYTQGSRAHAQQSTTYTNAQSTVSYPRYWKN